MEHSSKSLSLDLLTDKKKKKKPQKVKHNQDDNFLCTYLEFAFS